MVAAMENGLLSAGMERPRLTQRLPKILVITPQPFFRVSGTPIAVMQLVRALVELGFAVDLVSFPDGTRLDLPRYRQFRCGSLPWLKNVPIGFSPSKIMLNMFLAWRAYRLLRSHRYDVVHAVEEAAFYAAPLARLHGLPLVVDLDSDIVEQLHRNNSNSVRCLARPADWLRRRSIQAADVALTIAPALTDLVRRVSPETPIVEARDFALPEMAREPDPDTVEHYKRVLQIHNGPVIAYTGNLDSRQGVDLLLEAFVAVLERHAQAILLIVGGESAEVRRLQQRAESLGVIAQVRLVPKRPLGEVADYMAIADTLISPRLEPLITPMKIYAYMASGKPIVATDLPTHRAVLNDDMAYLVAPSVAGLTSGIIDVLNDRTEATARARNAREQVDRYYTFQRFLEKIERAYGHISRLSPEARLMTRAGNPSR